MKAIEKTIISEELIFSTPFIFANMSRTSIQSAIEMSECRLEKYNAKEKIFDTVDFERSIVFILAGEVSVYSGKTLLSTLSAGDSFGAAALFDDEVQEFPTTIYAKSDSVLMMISQEKLELLIKSFPQISLNYIKFLSQKIRFLNAKIDSFSSTDTEEKTIKFLLSHAEDGRMKTPLNMTQISCSLSMGRASLYRILAKLEDIGAIEKTKSGIFIKDKNKLKNILKEKEKKK
jgi:CRP-like cAMP-binding protein